MICKECHFYDYPKYDCRLFHLRKTFDETCVAEERVKEISDMLKSLLIALGPMFELILTLFEPVILEIKKITDEQEKIQDGKFE